MAEDNIDNFSSSASVAKDPDSDDESFVKKVKSRVSELLPSSLSKWFGNRPSPHKAIVRQREDDFDEESFRSQPPSKRVKLPYRDTNTPRFPLSFDEPCTYNSTSNNINHFSQPIAGPSGLSSKKTFAPNFASSRNTEKLSNSDNDSESGESTSGYSSMPIINKEKQHKTSKINPNSLFNTSFGQRSLFSEGSVSPQLNSSLSLRRPSFNASTFGSPNFVDRTLSTKKILNSPFYNGQTTFGGAAAHRSFVQKPIQVKPVDKSIIKDNTSLSKTARRILDTLDGYTSGYKSLVSDVKNIPTPRKVGQYIGANPYRVKEHKGSAAKKELQVPTVPQLLKMKMKERLQDSTVAVREIATTSKSALNADEYKLPVIADKSQPHSSKIRNKLTSVRHRTETEVVETVKLPDVSLPITNLPKFDFSLPLPPPPTQTMPKTPERKTDSCSNGEFKFASPLILADNLKSVTAINDFKFSDPLVKKKTKTLLESPSINCIKKTDLSTLFKPPTGSWECTSCMLRNLEDKSKCVACETPKEDVDKKKSIVKPTNQNGPLSINKISGFGSKFAPPRNTWECPVCMVRNNEDMDKCMACETTNPKRKSDLAEKLKSASNTWECSVCMMRNQVESTKCTDCEEPNPSKPQTQPSAVGFGDVFKKKSSEWECGVCMVRNPDTKTKCLACETPKPGSESTDKNEKKSTFTFGIFSPGTKINVQGFTFGIPPKDKEKTETIDAAPVKSDFGFSVPANKDTGGTFKFGIKTNNVPKSVPTTTITTPIVEPTKPAVSLKRSADSSVEKAAEEPKSVALSFNGNLNQAKKRETTVAEPKVNAFSFGSTKPSVAQVSIANSTFAFALKTPEANSPKNNLFENVPDTVFGSACSKTPNAASSLGTLREETPAPFKFEAVTKKDTFAFGQAPSETPKEPAFNFKPATAPSTFGFGDQAGGFQFEAPKPDTPLFGSQTPAATLFNSSASTTRAIHQPVQNGGFNFGSSIVPEDGSKKTGFSFGTSAPPNAGIFSFGSSNANAAPATGGFNFGALPNPAPAFNADAKPSFNFTGGSTPAFSAQPIRSEEATTRKKIRAIRRTQR